MRAVALLIGCAVAVVAAAMALRPGAAALQTFAGVPVLGPAAPVIFTDPYLQAPGPGHVHVRWLSGIAAGRHAVLLAAPGTGPETGEPAADRSGPTAPGATLPTSPPAGARVVAARTAQAPHMFEDPASALADPPDRVVQVPVWRHEARVDGLRPGQRYRYWVRSVAPGGAVHLRGPFTLAAAPPLAAPVRLMLTSDFQHAPTALPGYAHAAALFPDLDGVVFAGDMVRHPLRAGDWLSGHAAPAPDGAPPAFFDALQGRATGPAPGGASLQAAPGGALLQSAPLYPVLGNHEVSGRFRPNAPRGDGIVTIGSMYNDPQPRWFAALRADAGAARPGAAEASLRDTPHASLRDDSHDFATYRALFRTPPEGDPEAGYYAARVGEVFLVALNVTRIWRPAVSGHPRRAGKYGEAAAVRTTPTERGFGEFLFARIDAAAPQTAWLDRVLASEAARSATWRVVVLHQSAFGIGANSVPVLADPVWTIEATAGDGGRVVKRLTFPPDAAGRAALFAAEVAPLAGRITDLRYAYPVADDLFATVLEPRLRAAGVDLVVTGHSHLWNRFRAGDMHLLETSHAGPCYGAYWTGPGGAPWRGRLREARPGSDGVWAEVADGLRDAADHPRTGDPQGRQPIPPTLFDPMRRFGESDVPLPFVCSDRLSVFSVLDSAAGTVTSYVTDTADPGAPALAFDRFALGAR